MKFRDDLAVRILVRSSNDKPNLWATLGNSYSKTLNPNPACDQTEHAMKQYSNKESNLWLCSLFVLYKEKCCGAKTLLGCILCQDSSHCYGLDRPKRLRYEVLYESIILWSIPLGGFGHMSLIPNLGMHCDNMPTNLTAMSQDLCFSPSYSCQASPGTTVLSRAL
jgi:hypothetical protein